ncbi:hypothetical protein [Streptomyces mutabilis]|uniref:Uncharacterized protein n=1 Tax=Streptomyces mutabilis TaxID=67332 RepID=A0A086N3F7_9ACTN|nr:hypothetical protein [Streptomyces mutabilis]KFG75675.1 hypothetical protein FM21_06020 [Streptomyces mutabilis]
MFVKMLIFWDSDSMEKSSSETPLEELVMPEPGAVTSHLAAADTPELVRAPKATFLSVGGSGRPGTEAFYRKMAFAAAV